MRKEKDKDKRGEEKRELDERGRQEHTRRRG